MSNRPKQEVIISYDEKVFHADDIVTVELVKTGNCITGRIVMIGVFEFLLDVSEKFKSGDRKISYENVANISHWEE